MCSLALTCIVRVGFIWWTDGNLDSYSLSTNAPGAKLLGMRKEVAFNSSKPAVAKVRRKGLGVAFAVTRMVSQAASFIRLLVADGKMAACAESCACQCRWQQRSATQSSEGQHRYADRSCCQREPRRKLLKSTTGIHRHLRLAAQEERRLLQVPDQV